MMLGSQLDVDGDEALRTALQIAAANVAVFQARLAEMQDAPFDGRMLDLYRLQIDAVDRLGRWGKAAIDVDLPGRQAEIAEHQAAQITTAFERAVGRLGMPRADLEALVNDFTDELLVLEHTSADALDDGPP